MSFRNRRDYEKYYLDCLVYSPKHLTMFVQCGIIISVKSVPKGEIEMLNYVISEEVFLKLCGKPKGKGKWTFGDRNGEITVSVGDELQPLTYEKAKAKARAKFEEKHYPIYRTVYLLSFEPLKKSKRKVRARQRLKQKH
jgi:hypothetical protein